MQATYENKMKTYCVKCKRDIEDIDPKMLKTKNNGLVMQSKCSVYGIKQLTFVKKQEAKILLSNLGNKTPLSNIPLLNALFWTQFYGMQFYWLYKKWMKFWVIFNF